MRILTGLQPSGKLHVGNYFGAIKPAIDAQGDPHISYFDDSRADLKYAKRKNGSWIIEPVDCGSNVGQYTSLALDAEGNPHISYFDSSNGDLKYAKNNDGFWIIETVDSEDAGWFTSLVIDEKGTPLISYYDFSNGDLKIATRDGGDWIIETLDDAGDVGSYSSLAVGP